jgi:D-glycero-D-manno-heptose 1,7-bisphosphate phosphatase
MLLPKALTFRGDDDAAERRGPRPVEACWPLPAAVLLDRDGVILEDVGYLSDPDAATILPGAAQAIARLNARGVRVAVVTNQSGVARGYFPESVVAATHDRLDQLLARAGAHIDCYAICPHHPEAVAPEYRVECNCRKPRPGMLLSVLARFGVPADRALMVGDKSSDLDAGIHAGCWTLGIGCGDSPTPTLGLADSRRCLGRAPSLAWAVNRLLDRSTYRAHDSSPP